MKRRVKFGILIVLAALVVLSALIFIFAKDNHVSKKDSYIVDSVDLYHASKEELIELDLCDYPEVFGKVKTQEEAAKIAAKVIEEVYGKEESPYVVQLNENADAWIVHGSLSASQIGGVASIAVDKETGEILMLMHTK